MAEPDKKPVTLEELLVSSLAQTDALVSDAEVNVRYALVPKSETVSLFQGSSGPEWGRLGMRCFHAASSSSAKKFRKHSGLLTGAFFLLVRVRIQVGPPLPPLRSFNILW